MSLPRFLDEILISTYIIHNRDGLGDITERHPELSYSLSGHDHPYLTISKQFSVDVSLDILRSYPPRTVSYIVLGPMTNLALMMRKDGKLVRERIGRVICMGGALDVPGNTSPVAECEYGHFPIIRLYL